MKPSLAERDTRIDILRSIAIIGIIVAHSRPGSLFFQVRNFDVVLMVLLIGTSFCLSSAKGSINYFDYVKKRFNRLVVPTWAFLTIFFGFYYLLTKARGEPFFFGYSTMFDSYTLATTGDGIDYVWIMRVFFVIALACPLLSHISSRIQSNWLYLLLLAFSYVFYEGLLLTERTVQVAFSSLDGINGYLDELVTVLYSAMVIECFAYVIVAALGIRLLKLSRQDIFISCLVCLAILLYHTYSAGFAPTQGFKYPPRMYYLSYGVFMSLGIYLLLEIQPLKSILENRFVMYLSKNSAWLYFWHIIFIYAVQFYGNGFPAISGNPAGRFLFIFLSALAVTYVQEQVKMQYGRYRTLCLVLEKVDSFSLLILNQVYT